LVKPTRGRKAVFSFGGEFGLGGGFLAVEPPGRWVPRIGAGAWIFRIRAGVRKRPTFFLTGRRVCSMFVPDRRRRGACRPTSIKRHRRRAGGSSACATACRFWGVWRMPIASLRPRYSFRAGVPGMAPQPRKKAQFVEGNGALPPRPAARQSGRVAEEWRRNSLKSLVSCPAKV